MSNGIKNIVEHVLHPSSLLPLLYHAFAAGSNEKSPRTRHSPRLRGLCIINFQINVLGTKICTQVLRFASLGYLLRERWKFGLLVRGFRFVMKVKLLYESKGAVAHEKISWTLWEEISYRSFEEELHIGSTRTLLRYCRLMINAIVSLVVCSFCIFRSSRRKPLSNCVKRPDTIREGFLYVNCNSQLGTQLKYSGRKSQCMAKTTKWYLGDVEGIEKYGSDWFILNSAVCLK